VCYGSRKRAERRFPFLGGCLTFLRPHCVFPPFQPSLPPTEVSSRPNIALAEADEGLERRRQHLDEGAVIRRDLRESTRKADVVVRPRLPNLYVVTITSIGVTSAIVFPIKIDPNRDSVIDLLTSRSSFAMMFCADRASHFRSNGCCAGQHAESHDQCERKSAHSIHVSPPD
jgi:hypothetical protein